MGAQNIANGSASLEPDFSANTINTTWYSNGTQLTGNNIPATCTYDDALTPPTPAARPGYVFGGWTLKPRCEIPSSLVANDGNGYACLDFGYGWCTDFGSSANAATYGLNTGGQWGVSWESGDKVVGEAICSQTSGTWATVGTPDTTGFGNTQYCWCHATGYIASGAELCSFSSSSWVFFADNHSSVGCENACSNSCANNVRRDSDFRTAIFTGIVAQ